MSHDPNAPTEITAFERQFLREGAHFLETPGAFIRAANMLGHPIELLQDRLPDKARRAIQTATHEALKKALKVALFTIPQEAGQGKAIFASAEHKVAMNSRWHELGAMVTGTFGGLFGLPSLAIELPISTALMLRSIASTAQSFGADLSSPKTQLECLYVFTLSANAPHDAAETSYYASRLGLGKLVSEAAAFIAKHSAREAFEMIEKGSVPVLIRLMSRIAAQFEITVSEKVISESIPIIGAAGGALINAAFTHHFNQAAKFHFGIKQLEERYGQSKIRKAYTDASKGARRLSGP